MDESAPEAVRRGPPADLWKALARAFGGAIFFSLPLLMTMEMWWLGFYMGPAKISIFMILMVPLLIGLSHYSGIRQNTTWTEDVADAFVAYAVAFAASVLVLYLFDVIDFTSMPLREVVGKVALQAIPASFGAIIANSQLGSSHAEGREEEERKDGTGYGTELFLMFAGAFFLAFNVAPTEEMILIAVKMSDWHAVALVGATLLMMHGFVYSAEFRGTPQVPPGTPASHLFLRFTVVGHAIALLSSAYVLWTFGRYEGHGLAIFAKMATVLAFPAGLGAAAARLIL